MEIRIFSVNAWEREPIKSVTELRAMRPLLLGCLI
jgi:hypothetical protein